MKSLLIPVEGPIQEVEQNGLDDLQRLVGGDIQVIPLPASRSNLSVYCDESGKLREPPRPRNDRADKLFGGELADEDFVGGDVVVAGFNPRSGDDTDVPEGLLAELEGQLAGA